MTGCAAGMERGAPSRNFGDPKPEVRMGLQVQLRILPVLPLPRALESRAMEVEPALGVLRDANVVAGEKVPAFCAEARLAQGPPLLERIALLEQLELSAGSLRQR